MVVERASRSSAATASVKGGVGEGDGVEEEASPSSCSVASFSSFSVLLLQKTPEATEARAAPTKSCEKRSDEEEKGGDEYRFRSIDCSVSSRDCFSSSHAPSASLQ